MREVIGYAATAVLVLGGMAVLWAIFRFSIMSSHRQRRSRSDLRRPDISSVEQSLGISIPGELAEMYTQAPFVERQEFELVDTSSRPQKTWVIGEFVPLNATSAREWRTITNLKEGVPIATDLDKGIYFLAADGSVKHYSGLESVEVALSIAQFRAYQPREVSDGDA